MRTFISFESARELVLASAKRTGIEHIPLSDCSGRTLAADVVSAENIPPFDNSAMDGFAVRSEDCTHVPTRLQVIGEIPAGFPLDRGIESGECARIMTGAPVPNGADAIIPVEQALEEEGSVLFETPVAAGTHVRRAGEDVLRGSLALEFGTRITPPVIGMLATLGVVSVPVSSQPVVAILSTGDEIIPPQDSPGPGQIRNSNGPALEAQAIAAGGSVTHRIHVPDNRQALRQTIEDVRGNDLIVLSGGVSMGEYDFVRTELEDMGCVWAFWKVKQRPGKPLLFGTLGNTLVLGLPGNPVSSAVCFEVYVRPLLATMLGRKTPLRNLEPARLGSAMKKVKGLRYFSRGIFEPCLAPVDRDSVRTTEGADSGSGPAASAGSQLVVRDTGPQGSNIYSSMVKADCIIHLPEEMENPVAGSPVLVERLSW